jgi:ubiquinone biosynthesis protein
MRPFLREQFGADPSELFATFDWTPMASASVSQVYKATLRDGTAVVVKAQRPGLDDVIALDSAAVMQVARLIERRTPLGLSVRPADLAAEFLENVNEELDFRIEAANATELSAALARFDGVHIPTIHGELSGKRVLVEEMIAAPTVGEWLNVGERTDEQTRQLADRLIELFMHQLFTIGVFHADPHPGNILVADDGTIVLIDLGAVGHLGAGHRAAVVDMLVAAAGGNAPSLRHALNAITHFDRRVNIAELDDAIDDFLARHTRAGSGITAAAFEDLAVIVGRFGIRLPRWFGTLSRALVTLEGTLTGIDPTFSIVNSAREHAAQVSGLLPAGGLREAVEREAMRQLPRLRRIPEHIDELLGQVAEGRLSARVSLLTDERDERLLKRLVDRIVLAMIASAVGVGSVLLIGVSTGPTFNGSVTFNEVIGYFGLAAAGILALRVVAGIIRDGET